MSPPRRCRAMLSFVVPAYNEANQIAAVVRSIAAAADSVGHEHEIIVVDDASADETARLAAEAGATVVAVELRQISAVRNAGAAAARGEILVFVDGDTLLNERTLGAALDALDRGAVGGGALLKLDECSATARLAIWFCARGLKLFGYCGGCFMFVRVEVFDAVGGFDETLYASEEISFARSVRRHGRFVVLREPTITSGRKLRRYSVPGAIWQALRIGFRGHRGVHTREGLEVWYDGVREETAPFSTDPSSPATRAGP